MSIFSRRFDEPRISYGELKAADLERMTPAVEEPKASAQDAAEAAAVEATYEPVAMQKEEPVHQAEEQAVFSAPSMIAVGTTFEGTMRSTGEVIIEGRFKGDIGAAIVTVMDGGEVEGTVDAEAVRIAGRVHGTVSAAEVELYKTANVSADLAYDDITVERGAKMRGNHSARDPKKAPSQQSERVIDLAVARELEALRDSGRTA